MLVGELLKVLLPGDTLPREKKYNYVKLTSAFYSLPFHQRRRGHIYYHYGVFTQEEAILWHDWDEAQCLGHCCMYDSDDTIRCVLFYEMVDSC